MAEKKLTKVQKEIAAVLEDGGWIGRASIYRSSRPLYTKVGEEVRRVRDDAVRALRAHKVVRPLRIRPLRNDGVVGGEYPSGARNTSYIAAVILVHAALRQNYADCLEGVEIPSGT